MSGNHKNKDPFKSVPQTWGLMARCWGVNKELEKEPKELEKEHKKLLTCLRKSIKINLISACKERHIKFNSVFCEDWNLRIILDMLIEREYFRCAEGEMTFGAKMSNYYSRLDTPLKQVCRDFLSLNLGSGIPKGKRLLDEIDKLLNNDEEISELEESNRKETPEFRNIFPLEDFKAIDFNEFERIRFSDNDRIQLDNYVGNLISQKFDGEDRKEMKGVLINGHAINQYYKYSEDSVGYSRLSKRRDRFLKTLMPKVVKRAKSRKMPWIFVKRYLECLGVKEENMPKAY